MSKWEILSDCKMTVLVYNPTSDFKDFKRGAHEKNQVRNLTGIGMEDYLDRELDLGTNNTQISDPVDV